MGNVQLSASITTHQSFTYGKKCEKEMEFEILNELELSHYTL